MMHLCGSTWAHLKESQWNQALIYVVSESARFISSEICKDTRRFGANPYRYDWLAKARECFYSIARELRKVKVQEGESLAVTQLRLLEAHMRELEQKNMVNIRHTVRTKTSDSMNRLLSVPLSAEVRAAWQVHARFSVWMPGERR